MNQIELTGIITALANAMSHRLSTEEIALLASIFVQLGDTLATIAAANAICDQKKMGEH